jgi:hypothetical protein
MLLDRAYRTVQHRRAGALHRVARAAVQTALTHGCSGWISAHAATTRNPVEASAADTDEADVTPEADIAAAGAGGRTATGRADTCVDPI